MIGSMSSTSLEELSRQFHARGRSEDLPPVVDAYGLERLLGLGRYADLILTPDLLAQGLMPSFLEWVDSKWDAEIVVANALLLDHAQMTGLYAGRTTHHRSRRRANSFWLSPRLYSMAPVLFVVLRSRNPDEQDLQSKVRDAKGKSGYSEHPAGSFRSISPVSDRCLSLMHSADDYEGFLHEGELLVSREGIIRSMDPDRVPLQAVEVTALTGYPPFPIDPHPFQLLYRLVERGLAQLIGDPLSPLPQPSVREIARDVRTLRGAVEGLATRPVTAEEAWEPLRERAPRLEAMADGFDRLQRRDGGLSWTGHRNARMELCLAMAALCDATTLTARSIFSIVDVFRRNGIPLNDWEEQRLFVLGVFHGDEA